MAVFDRKIDASSGTKKKKNPLCASGLLVRVAMADDKADSRRGGIGVVEEVRKGSKKLSRSVGEVPRRRSMGKKCLDVAKRGDGL